MERGPGYEDYVDPSWGLHSWMYLPESLHGGANKYLYIWFRLNTTESAYQVSEEIVSGKCV